MNRAGLIALVKSFEGRRELPVEICEIQSRIVELGFQDEVLVIGAAADPGELLGVFCQFTRHEAVYGSPVLCTYVGYNTNISIPMQRVTSAKELVHIFDEESERPKSLADLDGLLTKLVGFMTTDDFSVAEFMALKDRVAIYECLPLLFPMAARADALKLIKAGKMSYEEIAERACLPPGIVRLVLSEEWPKLIEDILSG